MPTSSDLINFVDLILKLEGFSHRSKRNWYFSTPEIIQHIHLEKASFGSKNWLVCNLALPRMYAGKPPEFSATLFVDQLVPRRDFLARALDQDDKSLSDAERLSALGQCLDAYLLPTLRKLRTEAEVSHFYLNKKSRLEFFMDAKTAKFLGIWDFYAEENRELSKRQAENAAQRAAKKLLDMS